MGRIWDRDNLHAWCVVPFDDMRRSPRERAQMLADLGVSRFAYDWRDENIPHFADELEALALLEITLVAWWWLPNRDGQLLSDTLDLFSQHGVNPRLWFMHDEQVLPLRAPRTPSERQQRIEVEARRVVEIAERATGYGIDIYAHNDWLGIPDNACAVILRARELGVHDLGFVYNFSHARDEHHDDTVDFASLWSRIMPLTTAVNLAGTHFEDGSTLYPGDGEHDLEMMRVIEDSGWRGPVGVIAETGGDAAHSLQTSMLRVDRLAAQLGDRH